MDAMDLNFLDDQDGLGTLGARGASAPLPNSAPLARGHKLRRPSRGAAIGTGRTDGERAARAREGKCKRLLRNVVVSDRAANVEFVEAFNANSRVPRVRLWQPKTKVVSGIKIITYTRGARKQKSRLFTWGAMVGLAFKHNRNRTTLAEGAECSKRTIGRVQHAMAHCYLAIQIIILTVLTWRVRTWKPDFATCSTLWDETAERLVLGVGPAKIRQTSTWQVLVIRIRFVWGWLPTREGAQSQFVRRCRTATSPDLQLGGAHTRGHAVSPMSETSSRV